MSKKATAADAQLIMQLYDLRREAEMRKARNWWVTAFWPESADDVMKIVGAMGTQENNWMRQVGGYWNMAASFVLHVSYLRQDSSVSKGTAGKDGRSAYVREHREGDHGLQVRAGSAEAHAEAGADHAREAGLGEGELEGLDSLVGCAAAGAELGSLEKSRSS
jgi:hypothetical protein